MRARAFPMCWRGSETIWPRAIWQRRNSASRRLPGCSAIRRRAPSRAPSSAGPEKRRATAALPREPSRKERAKARLHLSLDGLGGAQDRACLEKIEHAEDADIRAQHEVGSAFLELVLHDGVTHHGDRRHQAAPWIERAARLFGAGGHINGVGHVGLAAQGAPRER